MRSPTVEPENWLCRWSELSHHFCFRASWGRGTRRARLVTRNTLSCRAHATNHDVAPMVDSDSTCHCQQTRAPNPVPNDDIVVLVAPRACRPARLLVGAHADDEVIFGGGAILRGQEEEDTDSRGGWLLVRLVLAGRAPCDQLSAAAQSVCSAATAPPGPQALVQVGF